MMAAELEIRLTESDSSNLWAWQQLLPPHVRQAKSLAAGAEYCV
jgi:hypothetical protein